MGRGQTGGGGGGGEEYHAGYPFGAVFAAPE